MNHDRTPAPPNLFVCHAAQTSGTDLSRWQLSTIYPIYYDYNPAVVALENSIQTPYPNRPNYKSQANGPFVRDDAFFKGRVY